MDTVKLALSSWFVDSSLFIGSADDESPAVENSPVWIPDMWNVPYPLKELLSILVDSTGAASNSTLKETFNLENKHCT